MESYSSDIFKKDYEFYFKKAKSFFKSKQIFQEHLIEDLTQEVFFKIFKSNSIIRISPSAFFYQCCYHVYCDYYRLKKRNEHLTFSEMLEIKASQILDDTYDIEKTHKKAEGIDADIYYSCLCLESDINQEIILKFFEEGYSKEEISEIYNKKPNTIYTIFSDFQSKLDIITKIYKNKDLNINENKIRIKKIKWGLIKKKIDVYNSKNNTTINKESCGIYFNNHEDFISFIKKQNGLNDFFKKNLYQLLFLACTFGILSIVYLTIF